MFSKRCYFLFNMGVKANVYNPLLYRMSRHFIK